MSCQSLVNDHPSFQYLLHPHGLAIFEDYVYWTDRRLQKVLVGAKYPNGSNILNSHSFAKALGLVAVHPALQPKSESSTESSLGDDNGAFLQAIPTHALVDLAAISVCSARNRLDSAADAQWDSRWMDLERIASTVS